MYSRRVRFTWFEGKFTTNLFFCQEFLKAIIKLKNCSECNIHFVSRYCLNLQSYFLLVSSKSVLQINI